MLIVCAFLTAEPMQNRTRIDNSDGVEKSVLLRETRSNTWKIEKVDWGENVGQFTGLALDSHNKPHISYFDESGTNLKYAYWNETKWENQWIDWDGHVGRSSSIVLDKNDHPHISYYDVTNTDLKYANWNSGGWTKQTVDPSLGSSGFFNSLALDSNNYPQISFSSDYTKYASWDGDEWIVETIEPKASLGHSIALDSNDFAHISYCDYFSEDLIYANWTGAIWDISTVDSVGEIAGYTSIAIDSFDNPHISYYDLTNGYVKYAKWNGAFWDKETVDSCGVGDEISLALDNDNFPSISYYDGINMDLKYAEWTGSEWIKQTVDSTDDVGQDSSLALDIYGDPHISYYDATRKDLKYAEMDNTNPSISDIIVENELINDNNLVLNLQIIFNEKMDISAKPTIQINGLSSSITNPGTGVWLTPTSYNVSITLKDDDDEVSSLNIVVDGGKDLFGNGMLSNSTIIPLIIDTKAPTIFDDSPINGTTGEIYHFDVEINDGFGIASVFIFWTKGTLFGDISMQNDGDSTWSASINLPHDLDDISYVISVNDTSGNVYRSAYRFVNIVDNDPPYNASIKGNFEVGTGEDFLIWASASDNIQLALAELYIRKIGGSWSGLNMAISEDWLGVSNTFELSYSKIVSSIGIDSLNSTPMEYYVTFFDTTGLNYSTSKYTITYVDTLSPTIDQVLPGNCEVTAGEPVEVKVKAWDNVDSVLTGWLIYIDVFNTTHNLTLAGLEATIATVNLSEGKITYRIYVLDNSGNVKESPEYIITVLTNDRDYDGVADKWDIFPDNPDEYKDTDGDGDGDSGDAFPNDPAASVDSDGDNFPDEWNKGMNYSHSTTGLTLDKFPYNAGEWEDTDQDGLGNNEDLDDDNDGIPDVEDKNPFIKDIADIESSDDGTSWWVIILIGGLILVVITVLLFILIKGRKSKKQQQPDHEQTYHYPSTFKSPPSMNRPGSHPTSNISTISDEDFDWE